jgi:serine/threonine protein kinase
MNPQRWQAVGELFDGALAVADGARDAWLDRASVGDAELRNEVLSLLASYNARPGGFVQHRIKTALAAFCAVNPAPSQPVRVGPYRLIRELGRGGMGTVFLAERDDDQYQSQVAVKLVRTGMDTEFIFARFRRERQTLARLQHPNIARLLDGGTTDSGLPYIVMEYVDGPMLTLYAKRHLLNIPDRLRLFTSVCSAVEYAHRNFVIHRDLKPGNILVGAEGVPKLLDFGICKLLHAEASVTDTAGALLTPAYASPEQVRGNAVTRLSDIYSLGVILYELLTEELPLSQEGNTFQAGDAGYERPIPLPSTRIKDKGKARQLSGDLDNIVMHALETEPERRYESAAQISDDLERYLANQPVHARPQTKTYLALKFIRRNRGKVIATAVVALALVAGLAIAWNEARLSRARLQAVYQSMMDQQNGDSLSAAHDLLSARQAYMHSAELTESCMKLDQAECLALNIQSNYKLAQNAVALNQREQALAFAQRALRAGESPSIAAKDPFVLAGAFSVMGLTYAALNDSPEREAADSQQAQLWLKKSLIEWQRAETVAGSSANHQRAKKEMEDALREVSR